MLRDKLLSNVGVETLFKGTKSYVNKILQGCRLCGEGLWSCLFIVGRCNQILDYVRENHLNIGVNDCSFFFKSRFQAAGFRKRVVKAINTENDVVTEKGYLRNRLNDELKYYTVQLRDEERGGYNSPLIKLKSKNFAYNKELLMQVKVIDSNNLVLVNLLNSSHNAIPEDKNMFEVWQYEHIENGMREY